VLQALTEGADGADVNDFQDAMQPAAAESCLPYFRYIYKV